MIALLHDTYVVHRWHIFLVYFIFVLGACLLNVFFVRLLPLVDRLALFWSLAGVTLISITILACKSGHYQSGSFVFGGFINNTGCGSPIFAPLHATTESHVLLREQRSCVDFGFIAGTYRIEPTIVPLLRPSVRLILIPPVFSPLSA